MHPNPSRLPVPSTISPTLSNRPPKKWKRTALFAAHWWLQRQRERRIKYPAPRVRFSSRASTRKKWKAPRTISRQIKQLYFPRVQRDMIVHYAHYRPRRSVATPLAKFRFPCIRRPRNYRTDVVFYSTPKNGERHFVTLLSHLFPFYFS